MNNRESSPPACRRRWCVGSSRCCQLADVSSVLAVLGGPLATACAGTRLKPTAKPTPTLNARLDAGNVSSWGMLAGPGSPPTGIGTALVSFPHLDRDGEVIREAACADRLSHPAEGNRIRIVPGLIHHAGKPHHLDRVSESLNLRVLPSGHAGSIDSPRPSGVLILPREVPSGDPSGLAAVVVGARAA